MLIESAEPYKDIRTLWFLGSAERQEQVKDAFHNYIIQISGTKEEPADTEVANYAFQDSLDDLDDLDYTTDYSGLTQGGGRGLDITPHNGGGGEALFSGLVSI